MIIFIKNLLPKLQQYSKKLDQTSIFIDKPWIMVDDDGNYHHYSFQQDGRLIMVFNGTAKLGSWEYITGSNSLLIDRGEDKIFLNQLFIHDGIMLLKKDGKEDTTWILINKNIVQDLNHEKYLKNLYISSNQLVKYLSVDQSLHFYTSGNVGEEVFDDNLEPILKDETIANNRKTLIVSSGIITSYYYTYNFTTSNNANVVLKLKIPQIISIGDQVILNEKIVETGFFKFETLILNDIKALVVDHGRITELKTEEYSNFFLANWEITLFVLIILLILIGVTINNNKQNESTTSFDKTKIDTIIPISNNLKVDTFDNVIPTIDTEVKNIDTISNLSDNRSIDYSNVPDSILIDSLKKMSGSRGYQ